MVLKKNDKEERIAWMKKFHFLFAFFQTEQNIETTHVRTAYTFKLNDRKDVHKNVK